MSYGAIWSQWSSSVPAPVVFASLVSTFASVSMAMVIRCLLAAGSNGSSSVVITSLGVVISGWSVGSWSRGGAPRSLELYNHPKAHGPMPLLDVLSGVLDWLVGLPALLAGLYALVAVLKPILLIMFVLAMFLLIE